MSLKNKILFYLEKNGRLSLQEAENLCKSEGYKISNLERRLREIMAVNPNIKAERNSARTILAYKWQTITPTITSEKVRLWNLQFQQPEEIKQASLF